MDSIGLKKKFLRILLIAAANNPHTVKWANGMVSQGHEVHIAFLPNHRPTNQKIDERVVLHPLVFSGPLGYYANVAKLSQIYCKIQPDVVNTHYATGYGTLVRLSRIRNDVLSVWGSDIYSFPRKSPLHKRILLKNLKSARAITSSSECMAREIGLLFPQEKFDISVIPFGVDLALFNPKRFAKGRSTLAINIGTVKTLKENYRIDTIIEAAALLSKDKDMISKYKLEFNIFGDGPLKDRLQQLIESCDLHKTVFLKGSIPNNKVPRVLSRMDIFCVASQHESFGVAVLEAMAMGVPVVASDVDGFREVIGDSGAGILVPVGNSQAMSHAIKEIILLSCNDKRAMSEGGIRRVQGEYDWQSCLAKMITLFRASGA